MILDLKVAVLDLNNQMCTGLLDLRQCQELEKHQQIRYQALLRHGAAVWSFGTFPIVPDLCLCLQNDCFSLEGSCLLSPVVVRLGGLRTKE